MRIALIVTLSMCGAVLLVALWFWLVVFKKSLRKMIFTFIGIAVDRDRLVDPDAPIEPLTEEPLSHILEDRAEQLDFEAAVEQRRPKERPKAEIPPDERGDAARDTSDGGWPRHLDDETRREKHPFRAVHLRTETEQTHEILDVDTYVEKEDD